MSASMEPKSEGDLKLEGGVLPVPKKVEQSSEISLQKIDLAEREEAAVVRTDQEQIKEVRADLAKKPVEKQSSKIKIIPDLEVTQEKTSAYKEATEKQRQWSTVFKKFFGLEKKIGGKNQIGYTELTNYPGLFSYEVNYVGERYWRLVTNYLKNMMF